MSVKTSTFGGIYLSGEDAKKFVTQVRHGRPKQAAKDAARQGKVMVDEFNSKGYVTLVARMPK